MNIRNILLLAALHTSMFASNSPYTSHTSVSIPYTNSDGSPRVKMGFDGSSTHTDFIMDTGSVGIVASSDLFTPEHGARNLGKGRQYYTSSGIIEEGTWWTATQQFYDENDNLIATAEVPVLRVTSIECGKHARDCTPDRSPKGISVMGIGFARESKSQPRGTPSYNAFLNLKTIVKNGHEERLPDEWVNGYVVARDHVELGLTQENTKDAGFVKLAPWQEHSTKTLSEWHPAPMTLAINSVSGDGNILMDTGVGDAFVSLPAGADIGSLVQCPNAKLVECVADGNTFEVYLPNQENPVAYYKFTVGEANNEMQPDSTHVVQDSDVFFNTSRHFLDGFTLIYDNTNGYVGYIWNGNSPDTTGFVSPANIASSVRLSSSHKHVKPHHKVDFTAQAKGSSPAHIPTGAITFVIDEIEHYVLLDENGFATITSSFSHEGEHTIQALYSGDDVYIRSSSAILTIKVEED